MPDPSGPRILAEASGVVVAESGPRILVVDRRLGGLATTVFVLWLLVAIPVGAGLALSAQALVAGSPAARFAGLPFGLVLLAVSSVALALLAVARRAVRQRRARPVTAYPPVAVFDRESGLLFDREANVVAPLHAVRIARRMQLGSSSPKLVAETPGRTLTLARGNPFAGGLGDLEAVLGEALLRRAAGR